MSYRTRVTNSLGRLNDEKLKADSFYLCEKNNATPLMFGHFAPVFTNAVATENQLYTFFMSSMPKGYKAVGLSLKSFGFFPLKVDEAQKRWLKAKVEEQRAWLKPKPVMNIVTSAEKSTGKGTKRPRQADEEDEEREEVTEEVMDTSTTSTDSKTEDEDGQWSEADKEGSTEPSGVSAKNKAIKELESWFPRGPLGDIRLIAAILLLPDDTQVKPKKARREKKEVLIFAENSLSLFTLSPAIKFRELASGRQISEAIQSCLSDDRPVSVTFGQAAAVFDPLTCTAYIKAVIRTESGLRHAIITYQLAAAADKEEGGEWGLLELPLKEEGVDGCEYENDPSKVLQSAKCIAFWNRKLYVMLQTTVVRLDAEGNVLYPQLKTCYRVMIINLDHGNLWRTVNTIELSDYNPGAQHKFKWAQRAGPDGSLTRRQLLGVFIRFADDPSEKPVNSVWSLDLESFQWSCLNSGKNEIDPATSPVNSIADKDKQLTMISNPGLDKMVVAASTKELWILPRGKSCVRIGKPEPDDSDSKEPLVKAPVYYFPLKDV